MYTQLFWGRSRELFTLVLLIMVSGTSTAALDNKGLDFILAFNPNFSPPEIELHLTGETATSVTINYPVNLPTFETTVEIVPGNVTIVTLPADTAQGWIANTVSNNAVRAFAGNEFVVYLVNRAPATSDAALALPIDTMNTEYLVTDYNPVGLLGSQFTVYAAFDNTTVTITPTTALVGRAAGVPFDIVLNQGEGYHARGASTSITNTLTGTEVISDRPIGLVNGNGCTQVPIGTQACDHIFEVAQPVQSWGVSALAGDLPNRFGSIYRILASEDATTVLQDNAAIGVINRGEFIETPILPGDHLFSADKPIYVTQFMTGLNSSGAELGDPAMGNMTPSEQYLSDYTFSTVGNSQFVENYVTIVAEDSDTATLTLDGSIIGTEYFSPINGSGFSIARLFLESGTHTTSSFGVHGITVEGYNSFDSYIYPGGALFQFINPMGDANAPICEGLVTAGPPPSFSGSGEDSRPTEDVNGNGILDDDEDLNGNENIDVDTGIFFIELMLGASNLALVVDSFVPGDGVVNYAVTLVDPNVAGVGTVIVTDGAGNACEQPIELNAATEPKVCDADIDGNVDRDDIGLIFAARNQSASGPDDPMDSDGDGVITVLDGRLCSQQCTLEGCAAE
ncbi:MAG: IgGFc-binding protein [Gammaproteobacteria bacterium]|nr:IgGFc-binding protein [Gammaproteobacteria bacterium]